MKLFRQKTIWLPTWQGWMLLFVAAAGGLFFIAHNLHGFLAITERVANADIVVVEEWVPEKVARTAAREYEQGRYQQLVVAGLKRGGAADAGHEDPRLSSVVRNIEFYGVPRDKIIACSSDRGDQYRSSAMAQAVRKALRERGIAAQGLNVVAPAAHARKTWLAYRRALEPDVSVGIVAVLTDDYDPERWWKSSQGVKWVIANGAGWLHELFAGPSE